MSTSLNRYYLCLTLLFTGLGAQSAQAQSFTPKSTDRHLGISGLQVGEEGQIFGRVFGAYSRLWEADQEARRYWQASIQFDYGTLGQKLLTNSNKEISKEDELSKNRGTAKVAHFFNLGHGSLLSVEGGLEHKRVLADQKTPKGVEFKSVENVFSPVPALRYEWVKSKPFPSVSDETRRLSWAFRTVALSTEAVHPLNLRGDKTRITRGEFVEPGLTVWYEAGKAFGSIPDPTDSKKRIQSEDFFYRWMLRGDAELLILTDSLPTRGNWDVSLSYFLTPKSGLELRHFDGYFGHNLRDRKEVTSLSFVWMFQ